MEYQVIKCICHDKSFEFLSEIICKNSITSINELQKIIDVANKCKLCKQYIEKIIDEKNI